MALGRNVEIANIIRYIYMFFRFYLAQTQYKSYGEFPDLLAEEDLGHLSRTTDVP